MTRFLSGMFITSLVFIAGYVYGPGLLEKLFRRGDTNDWQDVCKSPEYRQMGARIYTSDAHGGDFRREPDTAVREELEAAGRKVFATKGEAG